MRELSRFNEYPLWRSMMVANIPGPTPVGIENLVGFRLYLVISETGSSLGQEIVKRELSRFNEYRS
jgi:hypothetical protein